MNPKLITLIWSLFVYFLVKINYACAAVELGEFFPSGSQAGDNILPPGDDNFQVVNISSHPFVFFGARRLFLNVSLNGFIVLRISTREIHPPYTPTCESGDIAIIAPFWADAFSTEGDSAMVSFRLSTDPTLLRKAEGEIKLRFPHLSTLVLNWLFIATWKDVGFAGAKFCKNQAEALSIRNTFQAILGSDGPRSFTIFNYNKINWTTGRASSGTCKGIAQLQGGSPAKAGFDKGDDDTFITIPNSCTDQIINITDTTNVGVPGKWIFQVNDPTTELTTTTMQPTTTP